MAYDHILKLKWNIINWWRWGGKIEEHFSVNISLPNEDNLFLWAMCSYLRLFFFFSCVLLALLLPHGESFPSGI